MKKVFVVGEVLFNSSFTESEYRKLQPKERKKKEKKLLEDWLFVIL